MINIKLLDEGREGENAVKPDMASYDKKVFGMFGGKEESVHICLENSMAGVMIDRFGRDITFYKVDDEHVEIIVPVEISPQFLGWIMSLGDKVKVTSPDFVVEQMKAEIIRLQKQYGVL